MDEDFIACTHAFVISLYKPTINCIFTAAFIAIIGNRYDSFFASSLRLDPILMLHFIIPVESKPIQETPGSTLEGYHEKMCPQPQQT